MRPSRRQFITTTLSASLLSADDNSLTAYLETNAKPDKGYGWDDEPDSALSPTFAVIAVYHLLKRDPPRKAELVNHVHHCHFPWPVSRKKDRPMRRFDYEQVQALLWLGADASSHRAEAETWTGPSEFTTRYEMGGNPILKQEAGALATRKLLGIAPTDEWRKYVQSRRRPNGSFNNTPGNEGSDGHVVNTWWGLDALANLGEPVSQKTETADWVRSCQLPNGGFTYAPKADIGAVDQAYYTWGAVKALQALGSSPKDKAACVKYLQSLRNTDGGFADRPGYHSNPVATWYALEALLMLNAQPAPGRGKPKDEPALPDNLKVFTLQFEAPGNGSPLEAVDMAEALRIHMWGAKNGPAGWIARAQQIADARKVPVTFFPADEEYGTYVSVPGLGTYSHLVDMYAAPDTDFGRSMAKDKQPIPWPHFRDERVFNGLKRGRGGNTWQFNENEEISRVLLDEAVAKGTFDAIASFHFGNENFLHTQPFLNPYRYLLATYGLQDAHGQETWWWGDFLTGFRTLYLAKDRSWEGLQQAFKNRWMVTIRHDKATNHERRFAGGSNAVREYMLRHESDWNWKDRRPLASVQVLRPDDAFEAEKPASGEVIRVRTWRNNTNQAVPREAIVELVSLQVDGKQVAAELVEKKNDIYHRYVIASPAKGRHVAIAKLKVAGGKEAEARKEWVTA